MQLSNDKWFPDFKTRLGRIVDEIIVVSFPDTVETFASSDWEKKTDYFQHVRSKTKPRNIYCRTVKRLCAQILRYILHKI